MFTFAQSVRRLSIGMLSVLILCLSYPVFAQNRASPDLALQDGSHQFIVKITQDRVESLKKKLNLQPDQMGGGICGLQSCYSMSKSSGLKT